MANETLSFQTEIQTETVTDETVGRIVSSLELADDANERRREAALETNSAALDAMFYGALLCAERGLFVKIGNGPAIQQATAELIVAGLTQSIAERVMRYGVRCHMHAETAANAGNPDALREFCQAENIKSASGFRKFLDAKKAPSIAKQIAKLAMKGGRSAEQAIAALNQAIQIVEKDSKKAS